MSSLILKDHPLLGKTVVALRNFRNGEEIMEFSGPQVKAEEIPALQKPEDDRYLQIGRDLYLGASGGFDDFFNHSCCPNAGLVEKDERFFLTAIEEIPAGEEILWDYSTYMDERDWEMGCLCGEKICRGVIRDFCFLPEALRNKYLHLGIVPKFIADQYR